MIRVILSLLWIGAAVAAHLAGFRADTCFLSGTIPEGGMAGVGTGTAYILLWLSAWVGPPILLLSVVLQRGVERLLSRDRSSRTSRSRTAAL